MLRELHERALAARQRQINEFERNKQERLNAMKEMYIPGIKEDLINAANAGLMVRGYDFDYNGIVNMLYPNSHTEMLSHPDLIDIVGEMLELWFTEEPNWRMPILFDNPYTCLTTYRAYNTLTVWFDYREPSDQYVVK